MVPAVGGGSVDVPLGHNISEKSTQIRRARRPRVSRGSEILRVILRPSNDGRERDIPFRKDRPAPHTDGPRPEHWRVPGPSTTSPAEWPRYASDLWLERSRRTPRGRRHVRGVPSDRPETVQRETPGDCTSSRRAQDAGRTFWRPSSPTSTCPNTSADCCGDRTLRRSAR